MIPNLKLLKNIKAGDTITIEIEKEIKRLISFSWEMSFEASLWRKWKAKSVVEKANQAFSDLMLSYNGLIDEVGNLQENQRD